MEDIDGMVLFISMPKIDGEHKKVKTAHTDPAKRGWQFVHRNRRPQSLTDLPPPPAYDYARRLRMTRIYCLSLFSALNWIL